MRVPRPFHLFFYEGQSTVNYGTLQTDISELKIMVVIWFREQSHTTGHSKFQCYIMLAHLAPLQMQASWIYRDVLLSL